MGIGTGTALGLAAALFHMLNHAIYKSCLFLGAGVVEKKTGTVDLDQLGGLATRLPLTFATCLVASLGGFRHSSVQRIRVQVDGLPGRD